MAHAESSADGGSADEQGPDIPTGNTYDKYESKNPVVRRLMKGFREAIFGLMDRAAPRRVLDVGCGEGFVSEAIAQRYVPAEVVGIDLDDPELKKHWQHYQRDDLEFRTGSAEQLAFDDGAFDTVVSFEVLEHVQHPKAALEQMSRVADESLVLSVPREPLWRCLNVMRGAYLSDLGNTPGHINHWSRGQFVDLVGQYGRVREVRSPLPWTAVLVDVSGR